ncbi:IS1634 family transposase [Microcoleus sp. CAWBG640]|uniref:IS1634 family transposase n=1 Tax=Microcoleus sp. CAWBG640 TaxID=2841653 RepID=UPI00312BB268
MQKASEMKVENLDHLGLIAGLIDEIGIVPKINELVGEQPGEIVSPGLVVKAMIINGLGMVSAPLYLFSKFFEGKAVEHLLGTGIQASHLNDDRLGRVLDKLYLAGITEIFTTIALSAAQKFEINTDTSHLDSSSFHLHGKYEQELPSVSFSSTETDSNQLENSSINHQTSPIPIQITYGYSRDHRPDLKQFILDLICSGDGDVPLFLRVASGNESDNSIFASICQDFKKQLNLDSLMVADSALYTAPNLEMLTNLRWLTRVPLSLKQAQQMVSQLNESEFHDSSVTGYRWSEHKSNYGGIEQRWLVVESSLRRDADQRKLEKNLKKAEVEAQKKLRELSNIEFACSADASAAASRLSKQLKYHNLTQISSREATAKPATNSTISHDNSSSSSTFKVEAKLELDASVIAKETKASGRFILATNVLDSEQLNPDEMIVKYKEQQSAERGFGFLKDPLFFTDSVFLKSPERIEGLTLVMGLCLLVYTLGQRLLRQNLQLTNKTVKNQLGKGTNRPTLRWMFQSFQSIHAVCIQGIQQVSNLTSERLAILNLFPVTCRSYYLLL